MGRGRAKAKQTKVARRLKQRADTDLSALEAELKGDEDMRCLTRSRRSRMTILMTRTTLLQGTPTMTSTTRTPRVSARPVSRGVSR